MKSDLHLYAKFHVFPLVITKRVFISVVTGLLVLVGVTILLWKVTRKCMNCNKRRKLPTKLDDESIVEYNMHATGFKDHMF